MSPKHQGSQKGKPTRNFLGFEKINLAVILLYRISSIESLREVSQGEPP